MKELRDLVRPNIWALEPYSCARDEFKGMDAHVFLDANESPYNDPINRYPDPLQEQVKKRLAPIKQVRSSQIFLGNGSDEAIDLVYRIFCEPGKDNVVAIAPTYGMYKVCADINNVAYKSVLLDENYQLQAQKVLDATDANTKVIWLCSPNNPTGNELDKKEMQRILLEFPGIVVIDEAYSRAIHVSKSVLTNSSTIRAANVILRYPSGKVIIFLVDSHFDFSSFLEYLWFFAAYFWLIFFDLFSCDGICELIV